MKKNPSSGIALSITLVTGYPSDAKAIEKTLAHVYPGVEIKTAPDEKGLGDEKPSFLMVDTEAVSGPALDHLLDVMSDVPAMLLVRDFAEVRRFSRVLSSRRSIVTRSDLEGMGLIQGIHHLLERQMLAEQLHKTSRHLKELSIRDELTRLFNHRHFDEVLGTEVKKANRYKRPMGLVIVAIKNFTAINGSFGHHEGDRILARAADLIREVVREVDVPARYGDNEFAVVLPESDEAAASVVAARIQAALATITVAGPEGEIPLATSCGIGALSSQVKTKEELIRTALGALIEAKRGSENSICTSGEMAARRRDLRENRQIIEQMHERIERLTVETERAYFQSVMKALGEFPSVKKSLMPHSERVAFFAQRLAESMGLGETESRQIYRAGLLHDTGKLAIDSEILAKPSKLSSAEQELMKQHPLFAVQILGSSPFFTSELSAVLHHHERMDGSGYPEGISGDAIPLSARILAIAEAWDSMITPQPWRAEPLPLDTALEEIRRGAGTQFDEELAERFASLISG